MRLKFLKALLGLYLFIFLSSVLQSCCNEEARYNGDVSMEFFYDDNNFGLDTIDRPFSIRVHFDQDYEVAQNLSLMNSAYATKCVYQEMNSIIKSSLTVSLDKAISIDSVVYEPGYNLLELSTVDSISYAYPFSMDVNFSNDFLKQTDLPSQYYIFQISGFTSDGQDLYGEKLIWYYK